MEEALSTYREAGNHIFLIAKRRLLLRCWLSNRISVSIKLADYSARLDRCYQNIRVHDRKITHIETTLLSWVQCRIRCDFFLYLYVCADPVAALKE